MMDIEAWRRRSTRIRAAAVAAMFLAAAIGAPSGVAAGGGEECVDDVLQCHTDVDQCVAPVGQTCEAFGQEECPGTIKCYPGAEYGCLSSYPYAEVCAVDDDGGLN